MQQNQRDPFFISHILLPLQNPQCNLATEWLWKLVVLPFRDVKVTPWSMWCTGLRRYNLCQRGRGRGVRAMYPTTWCCQEQLWLKHMEKHFEKNDMPEDSQGRRATSSSDKRQLDSKHKPKPASLLSATFLLYSNRMKCGNTSSHMRLVCSSLRAPRQTTSSNRRRCAGAQWVHRVPD